MVEKDRVTVVRELTKACGTGCEFSNCKDITGQKFNQLTAVRNTGKKTAHGAHIWVFKCDCGKLVEKNKGSVVHGGTGKCSYACKGGVS